MSRNIITYKDQEWPTKAYRKKMAIGCMDQTREGVLHALKVRGAMSVRDLSKISTRAKVRDGMTTSERIAAILKLLYEEGKVGMIEPDRQRGRPSYKFILIE